MDLLLVLAPAKSWAEYIGPAIVAIFFFILPIIRAIKESKQKQREAQARRPEAPIDEPRPDETSAREKWDELMRGEATRTAEPVSRIPAPPPLPRVSAPSSLESELGGPLSDLPAQVSEAEMERSFDEERAALEENERALRTERERREGFLRREREGAEKPRAGVEPVQLSTIELSDTGAVASAEALRRRELLGLGSGDRRAALRRALVGAEVLGRPVALRTGGEEIGPLALRR